MGSAGAVLRLKLKRVWTGEKREKFRDAKNRTQEIKHKGGKKDESKRKRKRKRGEAAK